MTMACNRQIDGKWPNEIRYEKFAKILKKEYLAGRVKKSHYDLFELFPDVPGTTETIYHQAAHIVMKRMKNEGILIPTGYCTCRISDKILEVQ